MKKVLYLYDNFPSYRRDFFSVLNKTLANKDFEFMFVYATQEKSAVSFQEKESAFPAIALDRKSINLFFFKIEFISGLVKLIKKEKPDMIVLQFHVSIVSYWFAYFFLRRNNIPYIIWDCNYTRDSLRGVLVYFRKALVDFTYRRAVVCITYGSVFRNYLINLGKDSDKVVVAQNTINVESILEKRSKDCSNRKFNHSIKILYVGALLNRKYVDSAIIAVCKLIEEHYDIYFDIVGDGPERAFLESLSCRKGKEDRVVFYGAKKDKELQSFFENADIFLLPGTGGLAVNEAMAYSLPIISTKGDDTIVDLIEGNGYLLSSFGNYVEIMDALKTFLLLPEEDKIAMSKKSEQIIKTRASLKNMVDNHIIAIETAFEL